MGRQGGVPPGDRRHAHRRPDRQPEEAPLQQRTIGTRKVSAIGLGGMPMSIEGRPEEDRSIRTIHAALDAGVGLIDTADAYARDDRDIGHGERLIAKALKGRRDDVIVATKGGLTRDRAQRWPADGRPEYLRAACEASLRALETDRIDLYQFHRPDPKVPYAESIGTFKELQDEGKVRWVGISNATVDQLEEALGIVDVVSVQNQLSLEYTRPIANGEVQACAERGIAFLAWSPLGGISSAAKAAGGVDPVRDAAQAHGVSPQQVALAWLLSLSPTMIPIPGSSRPETITDSLHAAELALSDAELQAISAAVGVP
jgi:aryl-alcohol dehydrogenase-like predicted oxidoreductase